MMETVLIYVTHPDHGEAVNLARYLVERRLAAAVNLIPRMETVYRWQDAVETGRETVMVVKTRRELVESVQTNIMANHPYECPCIAVLPVVGGSQDYLAWIAEVTKGD
jgi:periplasmic divalent cation tolerance protein